ncbi:hypothetical protein AKJ09_01865 [Labilithrix luteola]|uniref:Uncharacterized protein n=1 Tax=Labilithrix luteola TaxID=1391654 RepID=A0A0K1PP74_9BACT|nr:hypothetical protein AKJ09_01865 [Labilithrix luteola]
MNVGPCKWSPQSTDGLPHALDTKQSRACDDNRRSSRST